MVYGAKLCEVIARAFDIDVFLYDSKLNPEYADKNGWYDGNSIYIDINSGVFDSKGNSKQLIAHTLSHEIGHVIKEWSPTKFFTFADFLIENYAKTKKNTDALLAHRAGQLDGDAEIAFEEVVAHACETMLLDSNAVEKLAVLGEKDSSILAKIKKTINRLMNKLRALYKQIEPESQEAMAVREMGDAYNDLLCLFEDAAVDAAQNRRYAKAAGEAMNSDVRNSFAGKRAANANIDTLAQAKQLEQDGVSSETIRKKTGWFKSYDGKWRFEINDKNMKIDRSGILSNNPDIQRMAKLERKVYFDEGATQSDIEELKILEKNLKGVSREPKTLGEMLNHELLFNAYPQLKEISVSYKALDKKTNAYFSQKNNEIVINEMLRKSPSAIEKALLHEIQHAIQYIEGFATGASESYWKYNLLDELESERSNHVDWFKNTPNEFQELIRKKNRAESDYDDISVSELENMLSKGKYAELYSQYSDFLKRANELRKGLENPAEYYERTAGEIEARDVANRSGLTGEQRVEKRPDIDRKDVVFSDMGDVSFSKREIVGASGKSYGIGVYLDSELLTGLTESERKEMVKLRVYELAGNSFIAYDGENPVNIMIATKNAKFRNQTGKKRLVIKELYNKNIDNEIKKEAVVLVDELIENSSKATPKDSKYSHGWLDNYGQNQWDYWEVYLQESNGSVWKATLNIANAADGSKILYDVDPIDLAEAGTKKAAGFIKSNPSTANNNLSQDNSVVNNYSMQKTQKNSLRDYSYDALTAKPDMTVTVVDNNNLPDNRADLIHQAKMNAKKLGKYDVYTGNVTVHVDDIDADVVIGRKGLEHGLDRRFKEIAPVTLKAGQIIKNAIKINELTPAKSNVDSSYVLIGIAQDTNGTVYPVRFVVNKYSNELSSMDVLYAINAKKSSTAALDAPSLSRANYRTDNSEPARLIDAGVPETSDRLTGSTISISNLLEYINKYFPEILPEDVLKHFGHTSRPDGKLGESALYSLREKSNREILAEALETTVDYSSRSEYERHTLEKYKSEIDTLNNLQEHLKDVKSQIKDISFSTGTRDMAKLRELKEEKIKTENRISNHDGALLRLEATAPIKELLERQKAKLIKQGKELMKQGVMYSKEKTNTRTEKEKLQKLVDSTITWLTAPSKTDVKCPDVLRGALQPFLNTIDMSSKRKLAGGEATKLDMKMAERMDTLATKIAELSRNQSESIGNEASDSSSDSNIASNLGYLDLPTDFVDGIRELSEKIKKASDGGKTYTVNEMSSEEIKELRRTLRTLVHAVKNMGRMYNNILFENVQEAARSTVKYLDSLGRRENIHGVEVYTAWTNVQCAPLGCKLNSNKRFRGFIICLICRGEIFRKI